MGICSPVSGSNCESYRDIEERSTQTVGIILAEGGDKSDMEKRMPLLMSRVIIITDRAFLPYRGIQTHLPISTRPIKESD